MFFSWKIWITRKRIRTGCWPLRSLDWCCFAGQNLCKSIFLHSPTFWLHRGKRKGLHTLDKARKSYSWLGIFNWIILLADFPQLVLLLLISRQVGFTTIALFSFWNGFCSLCMKNIRNYWLRCALWRSRKSQKVFWKTGIEEWKKRFQRSTVASKK